MIRRPTRAELERSYDLTRGCLRPAYDRLAEAHMVRRHPVTDEISWPATTLEDDLRRAGLL